MTNSIVGVQWEGEGDVQLPYVAATCRHPFPTPSLASFRICATYSAGCFPFFEAEDSRSAIVSSRRSVLLRRHASRMSSRGDAPCLRQYFFVHSALCRLCTSSSAMLNPKCGCWCVWRGTRR